MNSNRFIEVNPEKIDMNVFKSIGTDWMLLTAGVSGHFNTMTASWGGMGVLWNSQVCYCFVRPHRYTFEFIEKYPDFTLSFFNPDYRPALEFCGTHSGQSVDKMAQTGLIPMILPSGAVSFNEASLIFDCIKIYSDDLDPAHFMDPEIISHYPSNDFHRMYIGRIRSAFQSKLPLNPETTTKKG